MLQALRRRVLMDVAGVGTVVRAWWDLPCDVEAGMAIDISRIDMYHLGFTLVIVASAFRQSIVELGITTVARDWNLITTTDIPRPGNPGTIAQMYDEMFYQSDSSANLMSMMRETREQITYFDPPLRLCQSRVQAVGLMRGTPVSAERWELIMWATPVRVTQVEALKLHDYWSREDAVGSSVAVG